VLAELDKYPSEPCLPKQTDPVVWWRGNGTRFPLLSDLAVCPSKPLFSMAGDAQKKDDVCCLEMFNT